jgi:CII-binding regulator of phage lambda lysogenization HflD
MSKKVPSNLSDIRIIDGIVMMKKLLNAIEHSQAVEKGNFEVKLNNILTDNQMEILMIWGGHKNKSTSMKKLLSDCGISMFWRNQL